jgi:hypothetical protein
VKRETRRQAAGLMFSLRGFRGFRLGPPQQFFNSASGDYARFGFSIGNNIIIRRVV